MSNILMLFVDSPSASQRFYEGLFEAKSPEASDTFVFFILPTGLHLGLWRRGDVQPAVTAPPGGSEIGFKVEDAAAVDATYEAWKAKGATIALPPTDLEFGRSFVALDPDGHRLRVYALSDAA
jgi:catechol 2,3-dioxygenase-like lactoylglutathione lyase family enzyme